MDLRALLMGLAFSLMWSSAFTSARFIVLDASPLFALAVRFAIAGTIAVTLARLLGQSWKMTSGQWAAILVFGLCQNSIYLGLNFVAVQWVDASVTVIIASTLPLLVALAGFVFFGERLKPLAIGGLFAGFAGVILIMSARLSAGLDPLGVVLCVLGAISLTIATLTLRGASSSGNVLMVIGLQMLVGSMGLILPALALEDIHVNLNATFLTAFAYTLFVPGLIATWVWFQLVRQIGAIRAATFHFMNPFFGVAVASVMLDEHLSATDMIGVAIIMAGILAVQLSKQPADR